MIPSQLNNGKGLTLENRTRLVFPTIFVMFFFHRVEEGSKGSNVDQNVSEDILWKKTMLICSSGRSYLSAKLVRFNAKTMSSFFQFRSFSIVNSQSASKNILRTSFDSIMRICQINQILFTVSDIARLLFSTKQK